MLDTVVSIITCLSPIICAWIAYNSSVTTKKTKEYMELQSKYNKELEEKKEREAEAQKQAMEQMKKDIELLGEKFDDLANQFSLEGIHTKLEHLTTMTQLNFEYSQSLSSVICAIGDCVERANLNGTDEIGTEMDEHRKREKEFANRLAKTVV
ncbi:MAG: hypothetical protein NC548_05680 [Lachnospiraceae bacterium]|nr:hypothetical protein [Lachnospiraceae bacterium]